MLPTCTLMLAVSLFTPLVPTQISPTFNAVLQLLPDPLHKGQSTPCLCGQLFFLSADGNFATPDGDLYVLLEPLKSKGESKESIPEVFHFDSTTLKKLQTRDERFGDCYTVALPWPKGWKGVVQVRSSVKFTPTAKWQPELCGPAQTILVDPPEADTLKVASVVRCCTANFEVRAPGDKLAAQVAKEAERQRKLLAEKWLGKELPVWKEPCRIAVTHDTKSSQTCTTFTASFRDGVKSMEMTLAAETAEQVLADLPGQVTMCVLTCAVGEPLPRWAEAGILSATESVEHQAKLDRSCRELLEAGNGLRLKQILVRKYFEKDELEAVSAQRHSLVRFLLTRKPQPPLEAKGETLPSEQGLFQFVKSGGQTKWDQAAKVMYGFDDVGELEEAWLAWMHTPGSILRAKNAEEAPPVKDDMHIPPTKLPK